MEAGDCEEHSPEPTTGGGGWSGGVGLSHDQAYEEHGEAGEGRFEEGNGAGGPHIEAGGESGIRGQHSRAIEPHVHGIRLLGHDALWGRASVRGDQTHPEQADIENGRCGCR